MWCTRYARRHARPHEVLVSGLILGFLLRVPTTWAQPVGSEFQVNTYTPYHQYQPAVGPDGAGGFVVVWASAGSSGTDTSDRSIQGQRYTSAGTAVGTEFQVNTYTSSFQRRPAVGPDGAGGFVVVWTSIGSSGTDTSGDSIQGQRFTSAGTPVGAQFQVNTYTPLGQYVPAVGPDGAGGFVVVWESLGSSGTDTDSRSVQGQRYTSAGTPAGGEFQVNSYTTDAQRSPAVGPDGAGGFVVVWDSFGSSETDTSGRSVQGQRYTSAGTPVGAQFQVNTYTISGQYRSAVGSDGAGGFVVVWEGAFHTGFEDNSGIQGRRYTSAGTPVGDQFQVNSYTNNNQTYPAVGPDGAGGFVVVWHSDGSSGGDTSSLSVQGQRYTSAAAAVGGQFQVNTYTTDLQLDPAVAPDGAGGFVVLWASNGSSGTDTSSASVQGQRYGAITTTTSSTTTTLPPTDLLPGRITVIKPGTLAKFVAKPVTGDTFALPSGDPVTAGGSLRIFDLGTTAGDNTYTLPTGGTPPLGWKGLGSPAGSKGYKYKGAGTPSDPCKVVLVRATVIKGVCKGTGITLAPPFTGDVGIVLSLGTTDRYCAQFGGDTVKSDATIEKRKNATAPGACP